MATAIENLPPLPAGFVLGDLPMGNAPAGGQASQGGMPPLPEGFVLDSAPAQPDFASPEAAALRRAELGKGISDFGRGVIKGGKELIGGTLQAGADIAGGVFPESEAVQQFRELLPEAVQRSRTQFEAQTGDSTAGKVGEFVGQAAPFVAALPAGAATLVGRVVLGAGGGAFAGGTGATTEQLTPDEALKARGTGAAQGAALGVAVPAAVKGIAGVGKVAKRLLTGRDADKILASRISSADAATALDEIKGSNISVLADVAGDEIRGLTRAVGKEKGGARNLVSRALEGRSKSAVERVSKELSKRVSNVDTYFGNLDDIAKARATVAQPLYTKAYTEATSIDRSNLNKLLQDQRIINALDDAKANLGVRLEAPANSLEALDGVKKSLDDIIGGALRGGQKQKAASFIKLKNQLLKELDAASPTYSKARRIFSDFKSLEDAQELGLKFSTQTGEQLKRTLSGMDNTQKEAFKIGVRANLQKTVSTTADGADPAKRIFGNTFKREQLKVVFGEGKQFNEFQKAMQDEIQAAETKFRVLGGARTDINKTDDAAFIEFLADGAKKGVIGKTLEVMTDGFKRRYIGLNSRSAKQLAMILTNKEAGVKALQKIIAKAPQSQKNVVRDAANDLGRILGIGAAVSTRDN